MVPDRPDFTNGTTTVRPGAVQLEAGVEAIAHPRHQPRDAFGFTTAVRVGIAERVEVRLSEGEPLRWLAEDSHEPSLGFGLKARLFETESGSGLGIQPLVQSRPYVLGARHSLPALSIILIGTQTLGPRTVVDVNVGGRFDPVNVTAFELVASASLGIQVHPRALLFLEAFAFGEHRPSLQLAHGADTGITVAVTRWFSFDATIRASSLGVVPEVVAVAGLTFGWLGAESRRRSTAMSRNRTGVRPRPNDT